MAPKVQTPNVKPAANQNASRDFSAGDSDDKIALPETVTDAVPAVRAPMIGANAMRELLLSGNKGLTFTHRGGSIPLLDFKPKRDENKSILVRFISSEKPSDESKAPLISLDVLDPEKYAKNPKNVDGAVVMKRALTCGHSLKKWGGHVVKKENATAELPAGTHVPGDAKPGEIVILTYGGELQTDDAKNPLKLYELVSVAAG